MLRMMTLLCRIAKNSTNRQQIPWRLTFSVTNRCNCKCRICGIWKEPEDDELSHEEIDRIFSSAGHFSWVNITGGEPLLRPDLAGIIRTIYQRSPRLFIVNFPTSGLFPDKTETLVQQILATTRIPLLMITVSLDGPPGLHDELRGVAGSWGKAVETYRRLRTMQSRRFQVMLGFTVQESNVTSLHETLASLNDAIEGFSPRELHLNIGHQSSHYYRNMECSEIPSPDAAWKFLQDYLTIRTWRTFSQADFIERRYITLAEKYLKTGRTPLPCAAGTTSCFISPNGLLYPCTGIDFPVGSLRDSGYDLAALFSTPGWKKGLNMVHNGACPQCWTPCEASNAILTSLFGNRP